MKAIYSFAFLAFLSMTSNAQNSYDALDHAVKDLSGTARYVGMGGALGALGGDISTMHSNPAGTGLFRSSEFAIGAGMLSTNPSVLHQGQTKMSFDYIGAVFSMDTDNDDAPYINFGIGIKDNRNHFGNLSVNVQGLNELFSQTGQMADYANEAWKRNNWRGYLASMSVEASGDDGHPGLLYVKDHIEDDNGNRIDTTIFFPVSAKSAEYYRATHGSNTECDLNLSVNIGDKWFVGASLGFYWLNMYRESEYSETGMDGYSYLIENYYETTGYGFDVKVGTILRPFDDSPFRVGLSFKTSTSYRLADSNGSTIYYGVNSASDRYGAISYTPKPSYDYEYDYRDPWSVSVSVGHTIGKKLAFGLEYEYQNFSNSEYTALDSYDNDYFRSMNRGIKTIAGGQHTYKFGVEYKPTDNLSLRFGYNKITSPYAPNGCRYLDYMTVCAETDWVNWKDTQRLCGGIGFRFNKCYLDIAYQYQMQKGDFYAFNDHVKDDFDNKWYFDATEISANRGKLQMTFGVKF